MRRVFLALLLACAAAPLLAQRSTPTPPALTVRGVVVDAGTGAALSRARVNVMSRGANVTSVVTDAEGVFSVGVPAGTTVSLRIVKAGYAVMMLGLSARQTGGTEPLRIEVPRGAVIAGRAADPSGEPALRVVARRLMSDRATWSPVGPDGVLFDNFSIVTPDERGEYRLGGLLAGRYVIDAYAAGTKMTFGPSGVNIQASPVEKASVTVDLLAGSETAIDLILDRAPEALPNDPAPHPPGSTIRGTVSSTDGAPVPNATVTAGGPAGGRTASTDAFGRFVLRGVAPGPVTVRATKSGYSPSQPGQRGGALPGHTLTIESGNDLDDLSIVLARHGVIGGTVVDEHGEPVQEAAVQLIRVRRQPTGALVGIREQGGFVQRSDDRGQFRISGIVPGDYAVVAVPPAETAAPAAVPRTTYTPAYYPDTPDFASAGAIRIDDGENVPGLILTMRRVPVARVAGVARTSAGLPVLGTVRLMSRHAVTIGPDVRVVRPGPDGQFVFTDVPPGDYLLQTQVDSGSSAREFAMNSVTVVAADPQPVMVRTSLGSKLQGTIVLEGGTSPLLWGYSAASATLDAVSSRGSVTTVGSAVSSGEPFTLSGLAGPTRVRVWSDDQKWYVKSIVIDGFDVTDTPYDFGSDARTYSDVKVVFSPAATITGRATDERAAPVRDYAVYVFATDREKWFEGSRWVKLARASSDGTFQASAMPPGEYWVAALDRVNAYVSPFSDGSPVPAPANSVDAELLSILSSRATRITLGEGQSQTVTLRLVTR